MCGGVYPTRKQILFWFKPGLGNPRGERVTCLFCDLELDRPLCLALHDDCPWRNLRAMCNIHHP